MSTKDQWVKQFEERNGRKPSAEEFVAAKAAGFELSETAPASEHSQVAAMSEAEPNQNQIVENKQGKIIFNLIIPIVAMVLALCFALLSFFVAPAWVFVLLTVLATILVVVSLVFSVKSGKKVLAIVATAVTGAMVFVSLGGWIFQLVSTQNVARPSQTVVKDDDEEESSSSSSKSEADSSNINDYIDKNASFNWTEAKFQKLKVSKETLKEIMKTYGKATEGEMSDDKLRLTYQGANANEYVRLSFEKQYDGNFILSSASAGFNQDFVAVDSRNYASDWTKEQYDALVADDDNAEKGTVLADVTKDHGTAYNATYTLSSYEEGEFTKRLSLSYSDYKAADDKLERVYLRFEYVDKDDSFHLVSKSGPKEDEQTSDTSTDEPSSEE